MMKKLWLSMLVAVPMLATTSAWATPQQTLSSRLDKVNAFSANFTQKVISPDGEILVDGTGDLSIKRPNLFRWDTKTPDASLLVSDGKTVWYYSPFVEQVTAMWLKDATEQACQRTPDPPTYVQHPQTMHAFRPRAAQWRSGARGV